MSKTVCQNTLLFHSHRNITARLMGGASLPTQDGCCLDRWIVNIDCARASVPVFRKVETNATFVMTC